MADEPGKVQYDLRWTVSVQFCGMLDRLPEDELQEVAWRIEREQRARERIKTVVRDLQERGK